MRIGDFHICLNNIRLHGNHGALPQERIVGADYIIDVRCSMNAPLACSDDLLEHTINYADIYDVIRHEFAIPSQLIEHVAMRISRALLNQFEQLQRIDIKLIKEHPPIPGFSGNAAVEFFLEK